MRSTGGTIVVGGGIIGAATLYELASRGVPAVLLEAGEGIALDTSYANGGMLTPSMPDPWNSPGVGKHLFFSLFDRYSAMKLRLHSVPGLVGWGLAFLRNSTPSRHRAATIANFRLATLSVGRTDELRVALNLDHDASTAGTIKIFETRNALSASLAVAELLAPMGLRFSELDRTGAIELEPALLHIKERIHGALHYPDDRSGDAHVFARGIAAKALSLGAQIRPRTRVRRLVMENRRIAGVETDQGLERAENIVLAAGNDTARLAGGVGIRLPIKPVKGYSLTWQAEDPSHLPRHPVVDDALHAAIVPLGRRIRAVGTAEFAGVDKVLSPERIDNLFRLFRRIYPALAAKVEPAMAQRWTGLRPVSADGCPFIGETPVDGLWINSGHGHLGWTMAAGSAELLVDLMSSKTPKIAPAPYRVVR